MNLKKKLTPAMELLLEDLKIGISNHPFIPGCKREIVYRIFRDDAQSKIASLNFTMRHYKEIDNIKVYDIKGIPGEVLISLNATMDTWVNLKDSNNNDVLVQTINADGSLKFEQAKDEEDNLIFEQAKDEEDNLIFEQDGITPVMIPVMTDIPVMEIQGIPEYLYFVNLAKNAPIEFYNIVLGSILESDAKGNLNDYSRGNIISIS
jgi:hypothetical protein